MSRWGAIGRGHRTHQRIFPSQCWWITCECTGRKANNCSVGITLESLYQIASSAGRVLVRPALWLRRSWQFLPWIVCVLAASAQEPTLRPPLPTLTHVDQIRHLSVDQASLGYPVKIRGVVTDDVPAPDFFVQDSTAGIYVEGHPSFSHLLGDIVEVQGITGPGKFAPVIREQYLRVIGKGTLPKAPLYSFSELANGEQDSQRVQIRGIVRSASVDRTSWHEPTLAMTVASGGGQFKVRVPVDSNQDVSSWID